MSVRGALFSIGSMNVVTVGSHCALLARGSLELLPRFGGHGFLTTSTVAPSGPAHKARIVPFGK
jgi:hypothetical protein